MTSYRSHFTVARWLSIVAMIFVTSPVPAQELYVNGKAVSAYAPVLEETHKRVPRLDPEIGLYVAEIKPRFFFVTDGVYQSAFLGTGNGVVVFDAPADYGVKLPAVIRRYLPKEEVKALVYSHGHKDHIGAAGAFKAAKDLKVIAHRKVADGLRHRANPDILAPNVTFTDSYRLSMGQEIIELKHQGRFHSTDADTFIYLPQHKILMVIDVMSPGYAPFKNFELTPDFEQYSNVFDRILAYDFDVLLTGHLGVLGTRRDVEEIRAYVHDVKSVAQSVIDATPPEQVFTQAFDAMKSNKSSDLAYRYFLETLTRACTAKVIDRWRNKLSGVDIWADGHCETAQLYLLLH